MVLIYLLSLITNIILFNVMCYSISIGWLKTCEGQLSVMGLELLHLEKLVVTCSQLNDDDNQGVHPGLCPLIFEEVEVYPLKFCWDTAPYCVGAPRHHNFSLKIWRPFYWKSLPLMIYMSHSWVQTSWCCIGVELLNGLKFEIHTPPVEDCRKE